MCGTWGFYESGSLADSPLGESFHTTIMFPYGVATCGTAEQSIGFSVKDNINTIDQLLIPSHHYQWWWHMVLRQDGGECTPHCIQICPRMVCTYNIRVILMLSRGICVVLLGGTSNNLHTETALMGVTSLTPKIWIIFPLHLLVLLPSSSFISFTVKLPYPQAFLACCMLPSFNTQASALEVCRNWHHCICRKFLSKCQKRVLHGSKQRESE